jgi:PKD repeat protein
VDFTDTSLGNPTSFQWNFGDGEGSSQQHPVHEYDAPGTYAVTLTVRKTIEGVTLSNTFRNEAVEVAVVDEGL